MKNLKHFTHVQFDAPKSIFKGEKFTVPCNHAKKRRKLSDKALFHPLKTRFSPSHHFLKSSRNFGLSGNTTAAQSATTVQLYGMAHM